MPVAHERFAKAASSILLLRADDCLQCFYTARVIFDRSSRFSLPVDVRFAPKATLDVNGDGLKEC
jgi:hypothetical protein